MVTMQLKSKTKEKPLEGQAPAGPKKEIIMKIKKIEKKLNLKKETLTNLNESELIDVRGGATHRQCTAMIGCYDTEDICPSEGIC